MSIGVHRELELTECTVEGVNSLYARGIKCEDLISAFQKRVSKYNPHYNAIITPNPSALEDAREIDRLRQSGEPLGPLAGIPVVIKDTMDMVNLPSTAGWHFLSARAGGVDLIPEKDSPVVARIKKAGCVILGKTNVPILSAGGSNTNNSWAGPTLNSAAPARMPGGSSAGTATAVGTSMAVVGLAEETGGSIQNPAAAQGLVGVKPTFGLVPNAGVVPLGGSTRDVVGPIARTVRDAALVLDVLAGYTSEDPKTVAGIGNRPLDGYTTNLNRSFLKGKRLGLYGFGWRKQELSKECATLYERAKKEIERCGATLIDDPFLNTNFTSIAWTSSKRSYFDARGMECAAYDVDQYLRRLGPSAAIKDFNSLSKITETEDPFGSGGVLEYLKYLPETEVSLNDSTTPPPLKEFVKAKEEYIRVINEIFSNHHLDGLVFPQMCDEPPLLKADSDAIIPLTVSEINIAGLPIVTVPAGYYESGSPFNLVFIGKHWSEAELLGLAYDYEQATHHRIAPRLEESQLE